MSANTTVRAVRGIAYGHGKLLDIYRPERPDGTAAPTLLLWHGVGTDERDVLEPLATAAAAHGVTVVVPDWRSDASDEGRAHLLASLAFTRERAGELGGLGDDAIVLAGWSRGGRCAAAVAVRPDVVGDWRPRAVVCLASSYTAAAATTGSSPLADLAAGRAAPVPFFLLHGTEDTVVPVSASREWVAALTIAGWPVRLQELPTDHAGVVLTEYDPVLGRCRRATASHAVAAGELSALMLAEAAGVLPGRAG